jgi:hypothetical protein
VTIPAYYRGQAAVYRDEVVNSPLEMIVVNRLPTGEHSVKYRRYFKLLALLGLLLTLPTVAQDTPDDGEWGILFYSLQHDSPGLYWTSLDGQQVDEIISYADLQIQVSGFNSSFGLSPDGRTIIFTVDESQSTYMPGTYLYNLETNHASLVAAYDQEYQYGHVWSPDGKWVAFCTLSSAPVKQSMDVLNVQTQEAHLVVPDSMSFEWGTKRADVTGCVQWLPNADKLIFPVQLTASAGDTYSAVFSVNIDGSGIEQLTPENIDVRLSPKASNFAINTPEGTEIYFLCTPGVDSPLANQICRLNLATSAVEQILDLTEFDISPWRDETPIPTDQFATPVISGTADPLNIIGPVLIRFAVAPDRKIALTFLDFQDNRYWIEIFDPVAHQLTYLTEGDRAEWFYRQPAI